MQKGLFSLYEECAKMVRLQIGQAWQPDLVSIWATVGGDKYLLYTDALLTDDALTPFLKADWNLLIRNDGDSWVLGNGALFRVNASFVIMCFWKRRERISYALTNLVGRLNALSAFSTLSIHLNNILENEKYLRKFATEQVASKFKRLAGGLSSPPFPLHSFFIIDRGELVVYDYFSNISSSLADLVEAKMIEEYLYHLGDAIAPRGVNVGGRMLYYQPTDGKNLVACALLLGGGDINIAECLPPFADEVLNLYEGESRWRLPGLDSKMFESFLECFLKHFFGGSRAGITRGTLSRTVSTPELYSPIKLYGSLEPVREKLKQKFPLFKEEVDLILEGGKAIIDIIKENTEKWSQLIEIYDFLELRGLVEKIYK
jgi:hypothetical protein